MSALLSFFGSTVPPYPNPGGKGEDAQPGLHWFHGTDYDPAYDQTQGDEDHDPERTSQGGNLATPDRYESEYGQHADEHWNTDLGVHFSSLPSVARKFATGQGGVERKPDLNSRVAHTFLHMKNPKVYGSEFDMAREAVQVAHKHGLHYLDSHARNDPQYEDHLDEGKHYGEIPGHDHLGYVDDMTNGASRRTLDMVDRGDEDQPDHAYDKYLALHPERDRVVDHFKQHLRDQGHDGIVYGNEYESPHGHPCAITFDDHQVNIRHWQWMHPSRQHLNRTPGDTEADLNHPRLVDRTYTPEHGHHWVGPEGQRLSSLLRHFSVYVGDPNNQPEPQQTGMFGDDQNIAWHQGWDVNGEAGEHFRRHDPTTLSGKHWVDGERRILQPDHDLHTTQDFWHGFDEDDEIADGSHYLKHPEDYSKAADDDLPLVGRINGKDWIGHGHHRLMSDRRLGRPTTVWYKDFDQHPIQKDSAHLAKGRRSYLENPYSDTGEWFHGTNATFEGSPDPQAAKTTYEHEKANPGFGGPQTNKLLGTHWSALHSVAHGFAKDWQPGRVFHARLKMDNPIHFEDEASILHHVWRNTAQQYPSDFHDAKHDDFLQFNYGHGATQQGIDRRLADYHAALRTGSLDPARAQRVKHAIASSMETHLQFHPHQHGIVDRYISDMKARGHDGITYGNAVEGPKHHVCAITFDRHQAEVTHVDRMPKAEYGQAEGMFCRDPQYREPGTHSHAHISAIHDEPQAFLHEVERYHNGGHTREENSRAFHEVPGNTGRGEYKYSAKRQTSIGPLYHGTTAERAAKILSEGFQGDQVHLTPHPDLARSYAEGRVQADGGGEPAVLKVDSVHGVSGHEVGFMDPTKARDAGAHYQDKGPEVLVLDPSRISGISRHAAKIPAGMNHGIFSETKVTLDPTLWDKDEHLYPIVTRTIMGRLDDALDPTYPDWHKWSRVYFAGGEASYWWGGSRDFDTLIGVNYEKFRKAHPEDASLSNDAISIKITGLCRERYNDDHWVAPWDGLEWSITAYVNPDSWDIKRIKPYSAYRVDTGKWIVRPPQVPQGWGPNSFDPAMWKEVEDYLHLVHHIAQIRDPRERARRGAMLYQMLHEDRRHAFGPGGQGWKDPSNAIWKALEYAKSDPVAQLVAWVHENAEYEGAGA